MPAVRTIKFLHRTVIIAPLYLLFFIVVLLLDLGIETLHDFFIVHIVFALLLSYATAHLVRGLLFFFGRWVVTRTSSKFSSEKQLNRYRECKQISYCSEEKSEHIVLLLHGFTTSSMDWNILANRLQEEHVDFYAPLLTGFGLIRQNPILSIHKEEWFRQVIDIYDLFADRYKTISVIGHSMGGMLACYLAEHRPVHELMISAPALFPQKQHRFYSRVIKNKLLSTYISWQIPMIPKLSRSGRSGPADTMDTKSTYQYFQYLIVPIRLLFAMLQAQTEIKLDKMMYKRLTLMYGKHDITVNNPAIEDFIQSCDMPFQRFIFGDSAHNIFVDFDREQVNNLVISLLTNTFTQEMKNQYNYECYS